MRTAPALTLVVAAALLGTAGCGGDATQDTPEEIVLGPKDGHELPGTDLERVRVGDLAPDFSLASLTEPAITLSDFRGAKNVVLVFYRGHW
ncbi:MAG: redoxin domain-containing protein [Gemmatimonadetes bacterium]|nr:redoxin domain-containing protein [Gemmatimonadota bacterium]